jgi:hypothetical protein
MYTIQHYLRRLAMIVETKGIGKTLPMTPAEMRAEADRLDRLENAFEDARTEAYREDLDAQRNGWRG